MRMLVIDGQRNLLTALRILIGDEHEVATAESVEEALPLLRVGGFDAIVCDAHMRPREAATFAESLPPDGAERVVFTTDGAYVEDEERIAGRRRLTKPFTERELLEVIGELGPSRLSIPPSRRH
jgi:CheY-like chemotaxis protein